jgi:hypothetical protein
VKKTNSRSGERESARRPRKRRRTRATGDNKQERGRVVSEEIDPAIMAAFKLAEAAMSKGEPYPQNEVLDYLMEYYRDQSEEGRLRRQDNWREFICEKTLKNMFLEYAGGGNQRTTLIRALHLCINNEYPIPMWLRGAFLLAWKDVKKSWDEVFGPPAAKDLRRRHLKGPNREIADPLCRRIDALRLPTAGSIPISLMDDAGFEVPKRAVDAGLFEEVGKDFNVSGSRARDIYYSHKKLAEEQNNWWDEMLPEWTAWLRKKGRQ